MDFKIVFIPAVGNVVGFEKEYETLKDAVLALDAIANYTLFLHGKGVMYDFTNCGMIFKKDGGDWVEIDDDGNYV